MHNNDTLDRIASAILGITTLVLAIMLAVQLPSVAADMPILHLVASVGALAFMAGRLLPMAVRGIMPR